ncbi:O-antigen ligase family protein [Algoriphagus sp. D3-2-R+10]|uniref:O-antigen ligase family protein n=1 Tax=Algoriphagus aurantiacus TaxID=3103948 RepID=UPI002B3A517A|nr:O-antigen ligase family protein [Algoriphagus sp. D3-2-R+10]MEB2778414.1 O-antigen ligase family protein [Algoriphagus sp. D3-2-R+10]
MSKSLLYVILVFYFISDNLIYLFSDQISQYILLISLSIYSTLVLSQKKLTVISIEKCFLYLFLCFLLFSSIYHRSIDLLLNGLLISIPFSTLENKIEINVNFINFLFIVQICFSILTYYQGVNTYGFIPGQAGGVMNWRISLFGMQSPPYTGFIASIVLLFNFFNNKTKNKWFFIALCAYWVAFSGSRTMYIYWLVFFLFTIVIKKERFFLKSYLPYCILLSVLLGSFFVEFILGYLQSINMVAFLIRTQEYSGYNDELDLSRLNLYIYFYDIFIQNPLLGAGVISDIFLEGKIMSGSEVWFITLFSSVGIASLFLNVFFIKKLKCFMKKDNNILYWGLVLFMVSFMLYSSYIKPYNYATVLLLLIVLSKNNKPL